MKVIFVLKLLIQSCFVHVLLLLFVQLLPSINNHPHPLHHHHLLIQGPIVQSQYTSSGGIFLPVERNTTHITSRNIFGVVQG